MRRVANPPSRPVMLFDGECRFCRLWIARWRQTTGDRVEYRPLQDPSVAADFPEVARGELEEAVHLIWDDGSVYRGADAVFRSLASNPAMRWPLRLYEKWPWLARFAESAYAFIASHRVLFSRITRMLWGQHVERSENFLTRWIFLRGLGVIYFIAFVSLWAQIAGLIGEHGILPASDFMSDVRRNFDANGVGLDRFRLLPTFCWWSASDRSLGIQCALGSALAVALIAGFAQRICLIGLWILYLSFSAVGQDFLGFQWDALLLETGLLAIFFAPWQFLPCPSRAQAPSRAALWLLRLLLFKLMFLSGVVKWASGDPLWHNLTALSRHYETQPLPNAIAWHLHQLPKSVQKISCAAMFAIEFVAPFLLFTPRRLRMIGGVALAILQVAILLSGNFAFFNWLTLVLCVVAIDDFTWAAILPKRVANRIRATKAEIGDWKFLRWRNIPSTLLVVFYGGVSLFIIVATALGASPPWLKPVAAVDRWIGPFRSVNGYGLFAVMTPDRPEIIVEGSSDGRDWKEYSFRYKPGALNQRPPFVAPHQPRLDWQMWFAALGDVRSNPWFVHFCVRLLQGSPEVVGLLEKDPFEGSQPKFVRARLYDYKFTTREERRRTGNWWKREFKREYLPAISLEMLKRAQREAD